MGVKIDVEAARRLLRAEAASLAPLPPEWVDLVNRLSAACASAPKTHIAMLGTALLAKAVDPRVDVFALKVSAGTPGAYSARNLAKEALAALAPSLHIDLGVTGREPLNNQPYFRPARITPEIEGIIRGDGLAPFRIVYEALERLDKATQAEAREALRAFLQGRKRVPPPPLDAEIPGSALPSALGAGIRSFVQEESEGGRRAQAIAAALLDLVFGVDGLRLNESTTPTGTSLATSGSRVQISPTLLSGCTRSGTSRSSNTTSITSSKRHTSTALVALGSSAWRPRRWDLMEGISGRCFQAGDRSARICGMGRFDRGCAVRRHGGPPRARSEAGPRSLRTPH